MNKTIFALIGLALAGSTAIAYAQTNMNSHEAREELMKSNAAHLKILGDMAKGETEFDAGEANAAAEVLVGNAQQIPVVFESETDEPESAALPIIWEQFDDFTEKANNLETAATAALEVSEQADLGAAVGGIGATCGACHETYREKR